MKSLPSQTTWRFGLVVLTLCTMLSSCVQSNNSPVISSLEADKDSVEPSDSCEIKCVASDADGDNLTYTWSATGGNISSVGAIANWTAPDTCKSHVITVVVTDSRGGEASKTLGVKVKNPG